MRFTLPLQLLFGFSIASLVAVPLARAQHHEEHHEEHHEGGNDGRHYAPRPEPPPYKAHQPGGHPHGPIVRQHPVRVLAPKVVKWGAHPWKHWEHPEFARPTYYWNWREIHSVSCIAEDSYGDQYPVTQSTFSGFGIANMSAVEDDALDRCYAESGGDQSCYVATCSHF